MAQIGNLGKLIVFEVSADKVLTFSGMSQQVKGRWTSHSIIGSKPKAEFLGADARSVTLSVKLNYELGVKPKDVIKQIEEAIENGEHFTFVLGGEKVGDNEWYIQQMSEQWNIIMSGGELLSCDITLSLSEYVGG